MIDQRPVDGDEVQPFDLALRQQKPVEGITRRRLRSGGRQDVPDFDRQDRQARIVKAGLHTLQRNTRIQFPNAGLDRYFPEAGHADETGEI